MSDTPALAIDPDARVAIVHDDLTQRGGAERVVVSLHDLAPEAPIFTSVFDPEGTFPELSGCDVRTTFMQRLPHHQKAARAMLPLYPRAFASIDLSGYDLVLTSSSRFAHGVEVPDGIHVVYCHSPARWLYWPETYFAAGSPAPPWLRPILAPVLRGIRRWDQRVAARPEVYVANSRAIAARITDVYGRGPIPVVNPPVDTGRMAAATAGLSGPDPDDPYFLVVSRLLPYKRADLAAEACRRLGRRLVVVGTGPAASLLADAGDHVEVRHGLSDGELARLLAGCTALVQAGEEDFGLMPVEVNAAGRPAVAYGALGALETIVDGRTGVLFAEQDPDCLVEALRRAEQTEWDPAVLRAHAETFGEERFHQELLRLAADAGGPVGPIG